MLIRLVLALCILAVSATPALAQRVTAGASIGPALNAVTPESAAIRPDSSEASISSWILPAIVGSAAGTALGFVVAGERSEDLILLASATGGTAGAALGLRLGGARYRWVSATAGALVGIASAALIDRTTDPDIERVVLTFAVSQGAVASLIAAALQ